jgi:hypothetical protein
MEKSEIEVFKTIDDVEMGVLKNGIPFLTGRSLAALCGTSVSTIINQKDQWGAGNRTNKFARLLARRGYEGNQLFIGTVKVGNAIGYAYPDIVCVTFLEYYAFEASEVSVETTRTAQDNLRRLALKSLRGFIYDAVGYDPQGRLSPDWRAYHDRVLIHSVPRGYFSVFKESADCEVALIRAGLPHDPSTVPDGSIGRTWSSYWTKHGFDEKYGARTKTGHNFPDWYPQAESNPQAIWIYPIEAIHVFRRWMDEEYIPNKFPAYLDGKMKKDQITLSTAELLIKALAPPDVPPALPPKST